MKTVAVTALLSGLALVAVPGSAEAKGKKKRKVEALVPAQWMTKSDGGGFSWNVDSSGRVNISRMGQVSELRINGSSFYSRSRMMTKDGREYVLSGRASSYSVTRRIKVMSKSPGVRFVEIVHNPGANPITVSVRMTHRINMSRLPVVDNTGQTITSALSAKATGIVAAGTSSVSALFGVTSKRSKLRPTIYKRHNYELQVTFQLTIPGKQSGAILHSVAQQNLSGTTLGKAQAKIFSSFQRRKWTKDLPQHVRKVIKNAKVSSFGGGPVTLLSLEEELGLAEGTVDLLAFGEETLLRGTASCGSLSIESSYGKSTVPFKKVAAIVGAAHSSGHTRIHFRDGQKLSGSLSADNMKFTMTTGLEVNLSIQRLDRLVLRASAADVKIQPAGRLLVETQGGDRLLVDTPKKLKLTLATRWGLRKVGVERIRSLQMIGDGQPGFWVTLDDKSRFRAFLSGEKVVLQSTLFGKVTFRASDIRAMVASDVLAQRNKDLEVEDILQPYLTLVGGDVLVGQIDLSAIHFASTGEVIPVPPSQIKVLTNRLDGETPELGKGLPFKAEIWGGGEVSGVLRQFVLPIQTADGTYKIPARDIVNVYVPTPQIPPALRRKMARLIRQLGDAKWDKRQAASRELKSLGALAKLPLEEARRQTKDPEVERRVKELLEGLDD